MKKRLLSTLLILCVLLSLLPRTAWEADTSSEGTSSSIPITDDLWDGDE